MQKHSNRHIAGRLFAALLAVCLLASCDKYENPYSFVWEQTYGQGSALAVVVTPDSGFVACGYEEDSPYLVKLSSAKEIDFETSSAITGRFTSVIADTSGYIVAGSSEGNLLLTRFDKQGATVWDTLITASYPIEVANISITGNNEYLVVASASADSIKSVVCGLLFAAFDGEGNVLKSSEIVETTSIFSEGCAVDGDGNIYLTITRRYGNRNSTAGAAKFNSDWYKIWETYLYNNPNFGAETIDVIYDGGVVYLSGRTETIHDEVMVNNSFMVALSPDNGVDIWKSYRERYNTGMRLAMTTDNRLLMLNRNCFVVSVADAADGSDAGIIRMFDACDSFSSTEKATSFCFNNRGNLLVAGSKGGTIFLAEKSIEQIDEY